MRSFRDWLALKIARWRRVTRLADPTPNLTTKADIDNLDIIWSEKNPAPDEVAFAAHSRPGGGVSISGKGDPTVQAGCITRYVALRLLSEAKATAFKATQEPDASAMDVFLAVGTKLDDQMEDLTRMGP